METALYSWTIFWKFNFDSKGINYWKNTGYFSEIQILLSEKRSLHNCIYYLMRSIEDLGWLNTLNVSALKNYKIYIDEFLLGCWINLQRRIVKYCCKQYPKDFLNYDFYSSYLMILIYNLKRGCNEVIFIT